MTTEQLTLISVGVIVNGLTFLLGLLAGRHLQRKDSTDDRDRNGSRPYQSPEGPTKARWDNYQRRRPSSGYPGS